MKNISINGNAAPKKLTVDDLKKVIGGTANPHEISAEDSKGAKVVVR
jgi:hypothetical protein